MLIFKLTIVPLLVGGISLISKKVDARVAGSLAALPFVSGPIFVFLALENSTEFAVQAAHKTLLGVLALGAFIFVFFFTAHKNSWFGTLVKSWIAFFAVAMTIKNLDANLFLALSISLIPTLILTRFCKTNQELVSKKSIPHIEIIYRMIAADIIVVTITTFASYLGPETSGVLTTFPVAASVLGGFTHRLHGPEAARQLLFGLMKSSFCISSFFFASALLLPHFSLWTTVFISLSITATFQWVSLHTHHKNKQKQIRLKRI